ncbi:Hypothetical_protein [Hexamita inflata]|uniref:Hypothetical_protein n=1 Tax=Hexamita inflata TaxID=28002 RepID=A0AA86PIV4_9EUKA|nr:Hypothetical protein HINF_LOCUS27531 [Hexamita inflata]CAI9963876.1 Hypothetical protein HINF_LOCUS51521 [Hexamita inflata]
MNEVTVLQNFQLILQSDRLPLHVTEVMNNLELAESDLRQSINKLHTNIQLSAQEQLNFSQKFSQQMEDSILSITQILNNICEKQALTNSQLNNQLLQQEMNHQKEIKLLSEKLDVSDAKNASRDVEIKSLQMQNQILFKSLKEIDVEIKSLQMYQKERDVEIKSLQNRLDVSDALNASRDVEIKSLFKQLAEREDSKQLQQREYSKQLQHQINILEEDARERRSAAILCQNIKNLN